MKLINLVFQGITERKETYDFGNRVVGCSMMQDANKTVLRAALAYVLYGELPEGANLPVSAELAISAEDAEYTITRSTQKAEDGTVITQADVKDSDGNVVAEGDGETATFVAERVGLKADEFDKLFEINPEATAALAADAVTRESFIAEKLAELATSDEVIGRARALADAEMQIYKEIEETDAVTRDELKEQQLVVDSDRIALESLRKEIEKVGNEISLAAKYQDELTKYYEATAKMDALKAKEGEMSALAEKASRSVAAKELASVFGKYSDTQSHIAAMKEELADLEAKCKECADRVEEGKKSQALVSEEYIAAAKRIEELGKALRGIIADGSETPSGVKIKATVDSYYEQYNQEIAELTDKLKKLTEERDALANECADLTDRKLAIRDTAEYKKSVQNGAILENAISVDTEHLKSCESRMEVLEAKRVALIEENADYVGKIKTLNAEVRELGKSIRGEHKTVEEAVNAVELYTQSIYADHLFVSDNEVQVDAVVKKIEAVEKSKNEYAERIKKLTAKRDEVDAHRTRLSMKLDLLNEKMIEYMSQNRLRDMSAEIEYGTRCPVCDGFVTYKKDLPLRDTKQLDDQIKAVAAELENDTRALMNAESAIGQYKAAATVGTQYLESLITTRDDRQKAIDNILKKYNAKSIPELFAMVSAAAERRNKLTKDIDAYRAKEAEARRLGLANTLVIDRIKEIDEKYLPSEKAIAESLAKHIAVCTEKLNKLNAEFNGESPSELLKKLQVTEAEYAQIEHTVEAKDEQLAKLNAEIAQASDRLQALTLRTVPVTVNDAELTYADVITKAYADYLLAVYAEIDKAEETKETCKIRLLALKKVVNDASDEYDRKNLSAVTMSTSIGAMESTAADIYSEYEAKFKELGISSKEDVDRIVLDDEELDKCRETLYKYDEDVAGTKEAINVYNAGVAEHAGYYDNLEQNVNALKDLKREEEDAVVALGKNVILHNEMEANYAKLLELNRKLTVLQARKEALEELRPAVQDGAIIARDLAKIITSRAQSIAKNISKDRYAIDLDGDGKYTLHSTGKNKVRPDRLTKEESVIIPYSAAFAYNEVMVALLAGDIVPEIEINEAICDKASLAPIMEYAKERDMIAIPSDETAFFRAVSKIPL